MYLCYKVEEEAPTERKIEYRRMVISEVTPEGKLYAQCTADAQALEKMAENLHRAFSSNPPLPGSYQPRRG